MMSLVPLHVAEMGRPLFGSQWLALLAILAGVAVFMVLIALVGRLLAATHPTPPRPAASAAPVSNPADPASQRTLAIIAAAVAAHLGAKARITSIRPSGPSVETLMQQWSLEGRREIYSSHKLR